MKNVPAIALRGTACLFETLAAFLILCAIARAAPPSSPEKHPVLPPEKASAAFHLPEGFEVRLIAAEPDLVNPMTMTSDEQGRIYVSLAHTYRYGSEKSPVAPPSNPVVRLELGADGRVARRVVVASGFENPVMGLAVRDGKLWATNLNKVFVTELDEQGRAGRLRTIVRDAETPWNPFGMYRLAFGRDGLLYLSVGDHPIRLSGTTNEVSVRGNTGAVFLFQPDGSHIELLVQGMRAPFSFDVNPFGQLWILSNGEGNPNRLIHAIPGADYHFQTRSADWAWLAGKHPLSPPVWENPPGAHTSVLAYYSSTFPEKYWGNLLVSNWGAHGFPSTHHEILHHVLDERGNLVDSEPFLTTTDPRFRPTQMALSPDGNLYVLDWYGRDDENDLTGRLYKISYVGPQPSADENEVPAGKVEGKGGALDAGGLGAGGLASRHHLTRRRAAQRLLAVGSSIALPSLARFLAEPDALAAAEALWTLRRSGWPQAPSVMQSGLEHRDWRVRRLAIQLLCELGHPPAGVERLADDPDPAVRLQAAIGRSTAGDRLTAVVQALRRGAAKMPRLRYQAALEVARSGSETDFEGLLSDDDPNVRLAGLIALDEAFHEGIRSEAARRTLVRFLADSRKASLLELLSIGERWPHPNLKAPVVARLQGTVSAEEFARGLAILRRLKTPLTRETVGNALEHFLGRVVADEITATTVGEKIGMLEIVAIDRPGAKALAVLDRSLKDANLQVRLKAHSVLVTIGVGEPGCLALCWKLVGDESALLEHRLETIVSLSQIEKSLRRQAWLRLLESRSSAIALVATRCLQSYAGQPEATQVLAEAQPRLSPRGDAFKIEVEFLKRRLALPASEQKLLNQSRLLETIPPESDAKHALRDRLLVGHHSGDPLLGRLAFHRHVCHRCHLSNGRDVLLGPSLAGIAATNPADYLVDSILYPSKVIKTGFMTEIVSTTEGKVFSGKVTRSGDDLVITPATGNATRVPLAEVEDRRQTNRSLMPESLETTMSEAELLDLVAYLATLRERLGSSAGKIK